ncbi:DUF4870 domain-containing protein [Pontimicrobium aquaticum]|uniref:DUF4870 domain-containing protein n=1 Tax=Pontimicrobium aquaticum TaxID=2565367 RepID=A0A4U0EW99_9FLAO|nr:DUF4870 domain-containing protein [Pontimicrobium aquaticum]TJY36241.1 DUF4870 domain-containing protein [Pontimicrobium aquaticum]
MLSNHHKNVAAVIHLSALSKFIFPLGNFIMPLIIWTLNKDKSDFVDKHGKQAINFQLSILLYTFLVASITIPLFLFGVLNHIDFPEFWHAYDFDFDFHLSNHDSFNVIIFSILAGLLVVAAFILEIIFIIIATSKANQGEPYKYPLTINFLK